MPLRYGLTAVADAHVTPLCDQKQTAPTAFTIAWHLEPDSRISDTHGMGNDTVELVSSFISPWTLKVLWALDFHKVQYSNVNYTPISGEKWLRRKTGKKDGLISVPVMFTPEDTHSQRDDGANLFPDGQLEEIQKWNRASDDILDHWRDLLFSRLQSDKEMRRQMMPPIVSSLGPITDWLSSRRIGSLSAKYEGSSRASSAAKALPDIASPRPEGVSRFVLQAENALLMLREALRANNGYVLGAFSYADITMAVAANAIKPIGPPISQAPEPMRRSCHPEWNSQYADLVEYRDRMIKEHFPSK